MHTKTLQQTHYTFCAEQLLPLYHSLCIVPIFNPFIMTNHH